MATQGLVTIMQGGQVVMKIVAGCDGMNASKLARKIRTLGRVPKLTEAYDMAYGIGFGEIKCLVVMGKKRSKHYSDKRLPRRYRDTFTQPRFNPRWKYGTADHICIVRL